EIVNESFRDMVNNDVGHRTNLKKAIASVTGHNYKIGPYVPEKAARPVTDDPLDRLSAALRDAGFNQKG
ncbi:MAG: hypothetical protein J6X61_01695, partial [Clostridia bacterium]|nr:hypothetical protein [Clostridia bacterium]